MIENRKGFDLFCHVVLIAGVVLVAWASRATEGL